MRVRRFPDGWSVGWQGQRGWLNVAKTGRAYYLDVWMYRVRWARPGFQPLFSERYGLERWLVVGRLAARRFATRGGVEA